MPHQDQSYYGGITEACIQHIINYTKNLRCNFTGTDMQKYVH